MNQDEEMLKVINSEDEINKRVFEFPTSQIKLRRKKTSYYAIINSLQFKECNRSLIRICERIDMKKINSLIEGIDCISFTHKMFYKVMLKHRYEKILLDSYKKLKEKENGANH